MSWKPCTSTNECEIFDSIRFRIFYFYCCMYSCGAGRKSPTGEPESDLKKEKIKSAGLVA